MSSLKDVVHARRTSRLFQHGRMRIPTPFFLRDRLGTVALSSGKLAYPVSISLTSTAEACKTSRLRNSRITIRWSYAQNGICATDYFEHVRLSIVGLTRTAVLVVSIVMLQFIFIIISTTTNTNTLSGKFSQGLNTYLTGAQIPGIRLPWKLNYVRRHLVFVDP
jgi:hypothetical protein